MSPDALHLSHVTKSFGPGRPVLEDLCVTVPRAGVTFVVGHSGSGKSVLCRLAAGLLKPDWGDVELLGQNLHALPDRALAALRRKAPYLVQGPALLDWLTVEQNVALTAKGAPHGAVQRALARAGVLADAGRYPATLGPGTQKRVSLARALALEPEFLLLDEPTTGLDRAAARQVNETLAQLAAEGVGALVVSHDFAALRAVADRVLWISEGRAGFFGAARDFLSSTEPSVQALVVPGLLEASFDG